MKPEELGFSRCCPAFYAVEKMLNKGYIYLGLRIGSWPTHVHVGHGHWWDEMVKEFPEVKNISLDDVELLCLSRGYYPSSNKVGIFVKNVNPMLWTDNTHPIVRVQIERLLK